MEEAFAGNRDSGVEAQVFVLHGSLEDAKRLQHLLDGDVGRAEHVRVCGVENEVFMRKLSIRVVDHELGALSDTLAVEEHWVAELAFVHGLDRLVAEISALLEHGEQVFEAALGHVNLELLKDAPHGRLA